MSGALDVDVEGCPARAWGAVLELDTSTRIRSGCSRSHQFQPIRLPSKQFQPAPKSAPPKSGSPISPINPLAFRAPLRLSSSARSADLPVPRPLSPLPAVAEHAGEIAVDVPWVSLSVYASHPVAARQRRSVWPAVEIRRGLEAGG
ncbi:hypothetical protein OH77DRAFT_1429212 [Trametes cingulata]|nr:hypothetical protein OH77DRAFT_1429212 [Trametes cingulata]